MKDLTYDQVKSIKADNQRLADVHPYKGMLPMHKLAVCVLIGVISYRVAKEYGTFQPSKDDRATPKPS
jgi:hypothetical protein